jgi:hypothetical protein
MRGSPFFIAVFAFAVGAALGPALWDKAGVATPPARASSDQGTRRVQLLVEENERLRTLVADAERTRSLARSKEQRDMVEQQVTAIRGLTFKSPVDYQLLDRKQIKATIAAKIAEVFSDEEFVQITAALSRVGLLPANYPLKAKYIDLLGEQVAAFYDQHQHKLFMFEDASLDNSQNRIVLAHELTHALQDQHFDLRRLPLEIKTNDDRAAAASALIEGEATLVMSEFMLKNLSLAALKDSLGATFGQDMAQLAEAPPFLRETLVFPYLRGQEFCATIFARGGYAALTQAYVTPPTSTAQILHPEKFLGAAREDPLPIEWPVTTVDGQKPIADNVIGEFGIRVLLTQWVDEATGERAAAGWRGDRYLCFSDGDALIWKTLWSNAAEAQEFVAAQRLALAKRYTNETDRARVIRWKVVEESVSLIDASNDRWAQLLDQQFAR